MSKYKFKFYCGEVADILRKLVAEMVVVDFIITSPPYNVGINYDSDDTQDRKSADEYWGFLKDVWQECFNILPIGGRIAINIPAFTTVDNELVDVSFNVKAALFDIGFKSMGTIIWNKNTVNQFSSGTYGSPKKPILLHTYEPVLIFCKGSRFHKGVESNIDTTREEFNKCIKPVWEFSGEGNSYDKHPAAFPEELVKRLLKLYSYRDDLVLDPFGGSGTVAKVCSLLNRRTIYIDRSKKYTQSAIRRVQSIESIANNLK